MRLSFDRLRNQLFIISLALFCCVLTNSCSRCNSKPEPRRSVPTEVRNWVPYTTGQQLMFYGESDTVLVTVERIGSEEGSYWRGDECKEGNPGEILSGEINIQNSILRFKTEESVNEIYIRTGSSFFSLSGQTATDTLTLRGQLFQNAIKKELTEASVQSQISTLYFSRNIGLIGFESSSILYVVSQ